MGVNIRQKPTGSGVWWVFINHRGVRKSKKIGRDKKLAKQYQKKLEAKILLGDMEMDTFNRACPLFKPYAEQWLALPHKRKDRTQAKYIRNLEKHVYPVLGKMELKNIKRRDLKSLFDNLAINGMAESNFHNIKAPMRHIFNLALIDEWIENNPLIGLTYSSKRNIDIEPLTAEDAFTLLDAVKEYRHGLFYPHFLTLIRTGIRKSELCGLKWDDFDFGDKCFKVQRQVSGGKEMKTKNGLSRIVDMTAHLTETIRALKQERREATLKKGIPFCDWVFTFNGRDPMTAPSLKRALDACLEKAGLHHLRIHDLRHSYATIRLMKGHNIGDVSYQMGHSSIKITFDTYTKWVPGKFKHEVNDLDVRPNATQAQPSKNENQKAV